jgi:hypothetical protein
MYILCAYPLPNNPIVQKIAEKNKQMISLGWAKKYYDKVVLAITDDKLIASSFFTDRYSSIMDKAIKDVYPLSLKEAEQFRMVEDINVFISPQGCSLSVRSKFFNSVVKYSGFKSQQIYDNSFFLMLGRGKESWTPEKIKQVSDTITDKPDELFFNCTFTPNQWGLCILDSANPDVTLTSVGLETTIPQLYVSLIMANMNPEDMPTSKARYMDL